MQRKNNNNFSIGATITGTAAIHGIVYRQQCPELSPLHNALFTFIEPKTGIFGNHADESFMLFQK